MVVGRLYNRIDPRLIIAAGALVLAVRTYLIGRWSTLDSAFAALTPLLFLFGLSVPMLSQTANTMARQNIAGPALSGATTAGDRDTQPRRLAGRGRADHYPANADHRA